MKRYSETYIRRRLAQARRELEEARETIRRHEEFGGTARDHIPAWEKHAAQQKHLVDLLETALANA